MPSRFNILRNENIQLSQQLNREREARQSLEEALAVERNARIAAENAAQAARKTFTEEKLRIQQLENKVCELERKLHAEQLARKQAGEISAAGQETDHGVEHDDNAPDVARSVLLNRNENAVNSQIMHCSSYTGAQEQPLQGIVKRVSFASSNTDVKPMSAQPRLVFKKNELMILKGCKESASKKYIGALRREGILKRNDYFNEQSRRDYGRRAEAEFYGSRVGSNIVRNNAGSAGAEKALLVGHPLSFSHKSAERLTKSGGYRATSSRVAEADFENPKPTAGSIPSSPLRDDPSCVGESPGKKTSGEAEPIKSSINAWKPRRFTANVGDPRLKTVKSLLNKLTPEKFERIVGQILEIELTDTKLMEDVIKEIFEKALFEPKFGHLYADLCKRIEGANSTSPCGDTQTETHADDKEQSFRRLLLKQCQLEFRNLLSVPENVENAPNSANGDNDEEKMMKQKKRAIANVCFVSELYEKGMIHDSVIHRYCLQPLLARVAATKGEAEIEAFCVLLRKTGGKLASNPRAVAFVHQYLETLNGVMRTGNLVPRCKFLIQDILEQSRNEWKVRREEEKAKKISEIQEEVRREQIEKEQQMRQMRNYGNRGRAGSPEDGKYTRHWRDAGMGSHPCRVAGGSRRGARSSTVGFR